MMFEPKLWPLIRQHFMTLLMTVLSGFAAGLASIAVAAGIARVIGAVFLQQADLQHIWPSLGWILLAALSRSLFLWLSEFAAGRLAAEVKLQLRQAFAHKLMRLGPMAISAWPAGELSAMMNDGVDALDAYVRRYLPQLSLAALVPLATAAYVLALDPLSGLILLLTAPLIPLFMILIGQLAKARSEAQWQRLQRMSGHFFDRIQGLVELRSLGHGAAQAGEIHKVSLDLARATFEVLKIAFLSALVLELLSTLSTAIVAVEIGLRVLYSRLEFVQALTVLLLAPEFYLPLRLLGARFHDGTNGQAAAKKIFAFLTLPELIQVEGSGLAAPSQAPEIEIRDLHFHYPARKSGETQQADSAEADPSNPSHAPKDALKAINLHIPAASSLALVGGSGSGKSTLAKLMMRLADPQQGEILVNGQNLRQIDLEGWRSGIAWLPEQAHIFSGSVADNIRLALSDADDAAVHAAAKKAQLHDFIMQLPEQYKSQVGENARLLSGGQGQRLALARAFLQDPQLVILDELTAQLDPQIEAQVVQNTLEWLRGRTAIIIAHRLSTIRQVDQIAVLKDGQVLEVGSHEALLAKQGAYAQMLKSSA